MPETGVRRTRAENNQESENNLININGNYENSPQRVRQANADIAESAPCFEDDNFTINQDGSHEYANDPTTLWNSDIVHNFKIPHKLYVDNSTKPKDVSTYYVSNNGDDTTARAGDEKRPWETIQGAIDASNLLPFGERIVLHIFSGVYTENITIGGQKEYYIKANNVKINGYMYLLISALSVEIDFHNSEIDYSSFDNSIPACITSLCELVINGGRIVRSGGLSTVACISNPSNKITCNSVSIICDSESCITGGNAYMYGCYIEGNQYGVRRCGNSFFYDCIIKSISVTPGHAGLSTQSGTGSKFHNCEITGPYGIWSETFSRDHFYSCNIVGYNGFGYQNNQDVLTENSVFKNCIIQGSTNCISLNTNGSVEAALIYQDCNLFAGSGDIVTVGPGWNYPSWTGKLVFFNCTVNKTIALPNEPAKYELQNNLLL